MRLLKTVASLLLFAIALVFFQFKFTELPPLGKFFDPFAGFWQNAVSEDQFVDEQLEFSGLQNSVKVLYDDRFVPHIFAQNDYDLYFMQGYITAKMRLWQMEMQTHAAAGRLSEIVGEKALKKDREARRIGLTYGAEKALEMAMKNDTSRLILNAYADGVNTYIEGLKSKNLPIEYKLLNYRPEAWSPLKTALLLKYMGNTLTGYDQDMEFTNFIKIYGLDQLNALYPDFPDTLQDPVIPKGKVFTKNAESVPTPADWSGFGYTNENQLLKPEPGNGSNNWAVSAEKTNIGRPILCNDPHLSLNLPSIWFEIQMHAPGINVYGASLPGAPGVIIGFNDSIAWGITNGAIDVKDWYRMTIKDKSRKEYLHDGKWETFQTRIEEFKVKGAPNFYDTVRYTSFGPMVYDLSFSESPEKQNLALRWTLHDPSNESITFYEMNRARNFDDYENALRNYECPGQNFVFASNNNDIAIRQQGKFPNRFKNQGKWIMDGNDIDHQWKSYIPFADLPADKNPSRGFVSSANQHPTDENYPYYYNGVFENYRNRRINTQLESMSEIKVEDMMRLQNDNFNLYAAEGLQLMLSYLNTTELDTKENNVLTILKSWVYFNDADISAPAYFKFWWDEFYELLWDEFDANADRSLVKPSIFQTIRYIQKTPEGLFTNKLSTPNNETMLDLVTLAFKTAVINSQQWEKENKRELTWANFKNTSIKHLSTLDAFSVKGVQNGGGASIVNATSATKGPSWRMIVSPGKPVIAFGIFPGGQSGNPGSKYYDNFIDDWAKGKYYTLKMIESDDQQSGILFKQFAKPKQ